MRTGRGTEGEAGLQSEGGEAVLLKIHRQWPDERLLLRIKMNPFFGIAFVPVSLAPAWDGNTSGK